MVQLLSFRCKLLYVVEVLSLIARENHGPVRFGGPDCAGRVNIGKIVCRTHSGKSV
jgi:hypothetical protein